MIFSVGAFSLSEKKPKSRPLPDDAKARNQVKARRCVLVEHALGGANAFGQSLTRYGMRLMSLLTD